MGKLLFNEQPLVIDKVLAKHLGLIEAIILQQIHYWIEINKKTNKNFFDNRYWVFNSIKNWHEKEFCFISEITLKRAFAKLEAKAFLISGNYNKSNMNRTKWYTINYEKIDELTNEIANKEIDICEESAKLETEEIEDNCPLYQNDTMQSINLTQCKVSKCTNAEYHLDTMQSINLTQSEREYYKEYYKENTYNNHPTYHPTKDNLIISKNLDGGVVGRQDNAFDIELEKLKKQIDYDEVYENGNIEVDEILKILASVMITKNATIKINRIYTDCEIIKSAYRTLTFEKIENIVSLIKNKKDYKIKNFRNFVLTVAYNIAQTPCNELSLQDKQYLKHDGML